MKTNLERAQDFVIGQCLSDYPPDATYAEIRDWMDLDTVDDETGEYLVTVWEPFENCNVLHIMDNMVSAVERLLNEQEVTA
jgi:hypothetical protein